MPVFGAKSGSMLSGSATCRRCGGVEEGEEANPLPCAWNSRWPPSPPLRETRISRNSLTPAAAFAASIGSMVSGTLKYTCAEREGDSTFMEHGLGSCSYGPTHVTGPPGSVKCSASCITRPWPPKSQASVSRQMRYLPGMPKPTSRSSYVFVGWKLNTNKSGPRSATMSLRSSHAEETNWCGWDRNLCISSRRIICASKLLSS
mmetsp:Transcript_7079/g.30155  ORF Transcript_7079/g.30155 Transcript_7079/m.30155 type:complete len:203 (+) Transcript_7079:491-1099(+)